MHRQENSMERPTLADVSVIVPCFNEEHAIAGVLRSVPKGVSEIIVVDNNSTDKSARIATLNGARVISENTQGYGSAIRAGLLSARGDIVAVFDADNQYPPGELIGMLDFLNERGLDFVSASRFPLSNPLAMDQVRRVGNWGLTLVANVLFGQHLVDSLSGMWLFRRNILEMVLPESNDMPFSPEIKIRAFSNPAIRFAEYHIGYGPRGGVSKLFPLRHGINILFALISLRIKMFSKQPPRHFVIREKL